MSDTTKESLLSDKLESKKESNNLFCDLIKNAIPFAINYFAYFASKNIAYHFLNESGSSHLIAAAGLAFTCMSLISLALYGSLNVGLISRASQAYGAKNYRLVGLYLHKAYVINIIILIPSCVLLLFMDDIFIKFGYDMETATNAKIMCSYSIPGIFGWMSYSTLSGYINACDQFKIPAAINTGCAILYGIASYITILIFDLGITGIAICFNVQTCLGACVLFFYLKAKDPVPGSFFWFTSESFTELWAFFKYECSAGAMVFFEWVSWEILYVMSGALGVSALIAYTIMMNNFAIIYVPNFALSETVIVFAGNAMGERNVKKAKGYLKAGLTAAFIYLILTQIFLTFCAQDIAKFYTSDEEAIDDTIIVIRFYQIFMIADYFQCIMMGVLRAIGKEKVGSTLMATSYYAVGIPLGYVLCFKFDLGLRGLALGHIATDYILFFGLIFVYTRVNWETQAKEIAEKLKKDSKEKEGTIEESQTSHTPEIDEPISSDKAINAA